MFTLPNDVIVLFTLNISEIFQLEGFKYLRFFFLKE